MDVQLRRSSRKRKCTDVSNGSQSGKSAVVMEEESTINDVRVRCKSLRVALTRSPASASPLSRMSQIEPGMGKSPVTATVIQNPINFYGKCNPNFSFSEGESTYDAAEVLGNVVKFKRRGNRENRVLIDTNSELAQKPRKKNRMKKVKEQAKSKLKKNPQKFPRANFMKKSLLAVQPQMLRSDDSDIKITPPKRKFFSSSTKEKSRQMTTTLFGKQRICAATILNRPATVAKGNGLIPREPMKALSQTNSSLLLFKNEATKSSKIISRSPRKEISEGDRLSQPNREDFLDSIEQSEMGRTSPGATDLSSLDCTFTSLASSDKENGLSDALIKSNRSELHVSSLQNLHIESPSTRTFIQHYHYSPPASQNDSITSDMHFLNVNSPCDKSSIGTHGLPVDGGSIASTENAEGMLDSPHLSPTRQIPLFSSPISSTLKPLTPQNQQKPAWPIRYSRAKENLSNLKSKRRASKSLLPAFKNSRSKDSDGKEQMIIDAGQNKIGAQMCRDCGMLHNPDSPEDVGLHLKFHNNVITTLRFQGWKKERVVREFNDGRVLLILPEDPKYALKKVADVKSIVDANLGFHEKSQPDPHTMQVYFFVMEDKIVGCLIAEAIKKGYRVIPSDGNCPLMCSTKPETAVCGINRIWTVAAQRRCQIASRLIDCMRTRFYFGCEVTIDQIAFSDPTPDGRLFAARYTCTENFLVYK